MSVIPSIALNDGHSIPQLGLGVFQTPAAETAAAVSAAFEAGYRHIDTAAIYGNEEGVGQAIAASGLPRDQLYITTKLWNADQGHDSALKALDLSLQKLKLDYVDLYLIHWPVPSRGLAVDSWKALIKAREAGKIRSIGVSNFRPEDLDAVIDATGITPVLNQIELHPLMQQAAQRADDARRGVITESWSPLARGGEVLGDPRLQQIADKYGKNPAQVILRWHIELGLVVIPKSVTPSRIRDNADIFDFKLDAADLAVIAGFNQDQRIGPDPATLA
ncbi:aldo/keto reductase [Frateuria aurantia]